MKLYTAIRDYGCDGEQVLGVFDTPEKAKTCCHEDGNRAPDYDVREYILNSKITLNE